MNSLSHRIAKASIQSLDSTYLLAIYASYSNGMFKLCSEILKSRGF